MPARARKSDAIAEGARWRRRAGQRPDEILDAALDEFLARGFDGARMEDVAARAKISKAGVYLYFDSKIALLQALIDREVKPIAQRAQALMRTGHADPVAALTTLATFARAMIAQPRVFAVPRLVMSIAVRFPEIAERYRTEVVEKGLGALAGLIEAGVAKNVFRKIDPASAARAIAGPLILEVLWTQVLRGAALGPDPAVAAARHVDLALHGLLKENAP